MRRTLSRTIRSKPGLARLFILTIFASAATLGIALHIWWTHSQILIARAVDARHPRYTNATLALSASPLSPPRLTLVSSLYAAGYSPARLAELRLVVLRNLQLASVARYELVHDGAPPLPDALRNASGAARLLTTVVPPGEAVTYRALFARANAVAAGSVAVVANADIYFDESLACAALLSPRTALALSRHPSPDCVAASGRGDTAWEPADFCAGYDPVRAASHDVFAFVAPLPKEFLDALGDLRVNQFGAENVVVFLLRRAGYRVINPCANLHAFHQHCDVRSRAVSAHQRAGSVANRRKQFAGAEAWGFLNVAGWAAAGFTDRTDGLDCLAYGLTQRERGRGAAR